MKIEKLKETDLNRKVIYQPYEAHSEVGRIISYNDKLVFISTDGSSIGKPVNPAFLTFKRE